MRKLVYFNGENYADVLDVVSGYVRCKNNTVKLHIFVPFKGDIVVSNNCYIINNNDNIEIVDHD